MPIPPFLRRIYSISITRDPVKNLRITGKARWQKLSEDMPDWFNIWGLKLSRKPCWQELGSRCFLLDGWPNTLERSNHL